ncbi:MAG TPA: alpha/beta hydrolase domain-containing protein, partial [Thermomicrobiales bacterium]|nr:alpha/beta hydrolase domain-containing protein [Thermomicrobiales bacterium]
GIRLPDVAVPVGTHLGWNPRAPETGSPEQIMSMQGSTIWFRRTRAEREAANDPRPSLEERYASRDDYLAKVRAAAEQLVEQRYMLEEDIETALADAAERYDEAMKG